MISSTGRAILAPSSAYNAMSTLDETQQPKYVVKATAVPRNLLILPDAIPSASNASSSIDLGESMESRTSERLWTQTQVSLNKKAEAEQAVRREIKETKSLPKVVEPVLSSPHVVPPVPSSRNLATTSLQPCLDGMDELDPSSPACQIEESFPTPPDSSTDLVQKPVPLARAPTPGQHTPQRPISFFSPTKLGSQKAKLGQIRLASEVSPSKTASPSRPPKRARTTPSRRERPHRTTPSRRSDSEDSFGETAAPIRLPPHERLGSFWTRAKNGNKGKGRLEDGEDGPETGQVEREDDIVMGDGEQEGVNLPTNLGGEMPRSDILQDTHETLPAVAAVHATVPSAPDPASPPHPNTSRGAVQADSPPQDRQDRHSPRASARFRRLPASGTPSSPAHQSQLFSSQGDTFGPTTTSQQSFHFAATQAASNQDHQPPIPSSVDKAMLGRAAGTSAATHTSGPSVPEHRKLGRTYPRSTTLDANSPRNSDAVRKAPAASTSGSLRNGDNRDGASRMASSGSHHADGATYQDTYVDRAQRSSSEPAALSPSARLPLENGPVNPTLEDSDDRNVDPIVTATRTRRVSRSALEAREQDTGPLEQTYIEEPSLPPPPPSRPTPRRYGKHRKRSGPTTPAADHGDSGVESNTSREALVDTAPRPSTNGVTLSKGKKRKVGGKTPPPKFSAASDASSSPVAEDPEDYSYRPPLLSSTRRAKVRNGSKQSAGPPIKRRKLTGAGSSRTPAISITSAITSVPSSSGGAGVRVFAWWGPSRTYFPGRIVGSEGSKVRVRFLDGDHAVLPIDKLRLCVLRKGDLMIPAAKIDGVTYPEVEVEEHWEGHPALIKVAVRGKPVGELPIEKLIIRQAVINQTFCDRVVDPKLLGREAGQTVSYRRTASPLKKKSSSTVFRDKIILITTAASKDKSSTGLIALTERITTNGGKVLDDWTKLFNIPDDAFGSGLKTTAAPFLLVQGDKMIMKPKLMAALATGIPCLDTAFVEAAIQRNADWRGFVVASGKADHLSHPSSQFLDPHWGEASWNSSTAGNIRQPFKGKKVFFLEPKSKDASWQAVRTLVPFCMHALGAASLVKATSLEDADIGLYDYVVMEDREKGQRPSAALKASRRLCNVTWLKQCLITGDALPPALHQDK